MRPPLAALRAELVRTAAKRREALATALYGLEALRSTLTAAAGDGFEEATVAGPAGLDLRDTDAAKAALVWLAGQKIEHAWTPRGGGTGGFDLAMSWRPVVHAH